MDKKVDSKKADPATGSASSVRNKKNNVVASKSKSASKKTSNSSAKRDVVVKSAATNKLAKSSSKISKSATSKGSNNGSSSAAVAVKQASGKGFLQNFMIRTFSAIIFIPALILFIILLGLKVTVMVAGVLLTSEVVRVMRNLDSKKRCVGLFYLGFCYYVLFLFFIIGTTKRGGDEILTFLILIACSDIGAYIFGSLCGGPKLCAKISPSKTVSGAFAGVLFPMFIYYVLVTYVTFVPIIQIPFYKVLIVCLLAEIGDLAQSALKRYFKIKDFANILPGHGGLLDRFDSSTIAIIYFYYFV